MGPTNRQGPPHRARHLWRLGLLVLITGAVDAGVWAWPHRAADQSADAGESSATPAVSISASVDHASVELGSKLTLTIIIEGGVNQVELEPIEFPPAFQALAQSQSSHVIIQAGRLTRSTSLSYVLLAKEIGTFQLGPFQVRHRQQPLQTEPIAVTVNKPVLPPSSEAEPQFTL